MAIDDTLKGLSGKLKLKKEYILAGAALVGAATLDSYLTQHGLSKYGTGIEANSMIKSIIDNYGYAGLYASKLALPLIAPFLMQEYDSKDKRHILGEKTGMKLMYGAAAIVGIIPFMMWYLLPKLNF